VTNTEIGQALLNLCPNKEWTLSGDNYADLVWLSDGNPPTLAEVTAEITALPIKKASVEAAVELAKEAAQAKLAAIGLTIDDLKALGL